MDGKLHTSDEDISNAFNRYFSSVFTHENPNTAPTFHVDKSDNTSLSSIAIEPSVVFEKLVSLKTGNGPDGWPAEVFKQCADQLCVPLSILFIKSLESGILPEDWKSGRISHSKIMHIILYATDAVKLHHFYGFIELCTVYAVA